MARARRSFVSASTAWGGEEGRSSNSSPPWPRSTDSSPLRVWKVTLARAGASSLRTTKPEARVAWPQSSTSTVGVNQRRPRTSALLPRPTSMNAVSERLFSAAIACITASGSGVSTRQTAAGFPANGRSAKASTWKRGRFGTLARLAQSAPGGLERPPDPVRLLLAPDGDRVVPPRAGLEAISRVRSVGRGARGGLAHRVLGADSVRVGRVHLCRSQSTRRRVGLDRRPGAVKHRVSGGSRPVRAHREDVAEERRFLVGVVGILAPAHCGVGGDDPERDVNAGGVQAGEHAGRDVLLTGLVAGTVLPLGRHAERAREGVADAVLVLLHDRRAKG